jgi:hypothetical protein
MGEGHKRHRRRSASSTSGCSKTAVTEDSNDAEIIPGMVKKWGLGLTIRTTAVPGGRRAGSLAWAGLGNTYFGIDLEPAEPIAEHDLVVRMSGRKCDAKSFP